MNTWKIIQLKEGYDLKPFKVSEYAQELISKMPIESPQEIELVKISVEELGFKDGATRKYIYAKALSLGLELCPAEVGPALRVAYTDQLKGEYLLIGMEPITDSFGDPFVFSVNHYGGGLWLGTDDGEPDDFWYGYSQWVFRRRKLSPESSETSPSLPFDLLSFERRLKELEDFKKRVEQIIKL